MVAGIHTCINCSDRHVGCHSTCEKYIAAKKIHDEELEKIRKSKNAMYVSKNRAFIDKAFRTH